VDDALSHAVLVERLAQVCHQTWMKQKKREDGIVADPNDPTPTTHDYERAEDIVADSRGLASGATPPERPESPQP
jgi:hypothetical protein